MVQSKNEDERTKAVIQLRSNFTILPDKNQAWADLRRCTKDVDKYVRREAADSLGLAFPHVPDKNQAWADLHRLTLDEDSDVRWRAAFALGLSFPHIPDKNQAWADLHQLVRDKDGYVRWGSVLALFSAFPHIPNKNQAWADIIWLAQDDVRWRAAFELGSVFPHIPDKNQAWGDLHLLTKNEDSYVRWRVAFALNSAFFYIPDKNQAWADLIRLAKDKDSFVRQRAIVALGSAFLHVPDKELAWTDLIQLTKDKDSYVREGAAGALGLAFPHVPDKNQAWADLHRLTRNKDSYVRWGVAVALGSAFPHIVNKEQAWKDLSRLLQDKNGSVRSDAVESLGIAFPHILDKKQAWNVLHWLTRDVRRGAAVALGTAFPHIPNKKQALEDLNWLARDKDKGVRLSANYSLGRASIFNATETESEEDFRKELEKAIESFDKSSKESTYFNPARFCLPFYRSFYTITFTIQGAEAELQNYLIEAKNAVKGSENKEKLLEAVENLSNALKEAKKSHEIDFDTMKCDLNAYRRYCERAASLLDIIEEKAPSATKLIKKGLPIIDKKIKILLTEIEEKAKKFCEESRQTPFEKISRSAYHNVKGLGKVESPIEAETKLNGLRPLLKSICHILPEESRGVICGQLDEIEKADLYDKTRIIESALSSISVQIKNWEEQKKNLEEELEDQDKWVEYFKKLVIQKLDNINYGVFQLKLRSGEIVPALHDLQTELNKFKTIKTDIDNFGLSLTEFGDLQHQDFQRLNNEITRLCKEIETEIIPKLPPNDTNIILEKIQDMKLCKEEAWFNRVASFSSIISLLLTMFSSLIK